jgi:hypothetical protein
MSRVISAAAPITIAAVLRSSRRSERYDPDRGRRRSPLALIGARGPTPGLQLSGARDIALPSPFPDRYSLTAARRAANQNGHSGGATVSGWRDRFGKRRASQRAAARRQRY